ncbi:MAG TPA: AAA family ATPase [Phycisphaerales bacterium]|nr:AAA family ATPase [Phycisphaerales bacterium]
MLKSLAIRNFRSCQNVQVDLSEPVIALLGRNGVGKTNVLHAIQVVADLCIGETEPLFTLSPHIADQPVAFQLTFRVGGSTYEYATERSIRGNHESTEALCLDGQTLFSRKGESVEVAGTEITHLKIGLVAPTLSTLLKILPSHDQAALALRPAADYLRNIGYYPLIQGFQEHLNGPPPPRAQYAELGGDYSSIIQTAAYELWKIELQNGRARRSVQMRLLHLSLTDPDRFKELKQLLSRLELVDDIQIERIQLQGRTLQDNERLSHETAYRIAFVPSSSLAGHGKTFRYNGLSAGTWRIMQLLTYLLFDQNSCMLLEQPEDSVHPGMLAKVIDILRAYASRTQLIFTTHSPRVVNALGPKCLRFVKATDGATSISELSPEEILEAERYEATQGTLAEFLATLE